MYGFPKELCCNTINYNFKYIAHFTTFYRLDPHFVFFEINNF